jgi:hypothetical protein
MYSISPLLRSPSSRASFLQASSASDIHLIHALRAQMTAWLRTGTALLVLVLALAAAVKAQQLELKLEGFKCIPSKCGAACICGSMYT